MKEIRYSLEQHLHQIAGIDKRVQSLESIYLIQKEKMEHFLSTIKTTFPTYSTHDVYHSYNIVTAIEEILGKKRLEQLSGADTFLLLVCAYMHDLGMLYTNEEVRSLWGSPEFQSFLSNCIKEDGSLKEAAEMVKGMQHKDKPVTWPLEIKKSIGLLLMEFFRSRHGERIEKVTDKRYGMIAEYMKFDHSFIPERISRLIYRISMAHNWNAEKILSDLPYEDTFNGEKMHPRFVALFLRLGDLCDLDNNRFDRVSIAAFGTLGDDNLPHYFKHKSVNTLNISKNIIHIIADVREDDIAYECKYDWMKEEPEAVREKRIGNVFRATVKEHILWRSWMEEELKFARLHCKKLFPDDIPMDLPDFEYKILINGKESASAKENMRFHFSMEKAFALIENISIYQDEKFIFIRELVQNAIDATKLQLWRDLQSIGAEYPKDLSPFEIERQHPDIYDRYPIEIIAHYDAERKTAKIKVCDCGIGISIEEFKNNILVTGNSWKKRASYQKELQSMPKWLRPTGAFGIGLHTVFYKTDQLEIHTKSETENHANKIVLYSGKKDGFAFCQTDTARKRRGSEFVFEFELDETQEEDLLDVNDEMAIFGNYEEKFVSFIVQEVKNWCRKPLFPVSVNGICIAPCMTKAEHSGLLSNGWNINSILGRCMEDKRYEYAFSEDYREIAIWDKSNGLFFNVFAIMGNKDLENPSEDYLARDTSFMGIRIGNGFYGGEKSVPFLHVNDIDILIGEADVVIDASRTKLNAKAIKRLQPMVYEASCFVRSLYMELLEYIIRDKKRMEMLAELENLLDAYARKDLGKDQIIPSLYQLEHKYFVAEYKNGLERKTLVYKLAYMLVDLQLLKDFDSLKDACMQNRDNLKWVGSVKFLGLLDAVLKHHKSCGRKGFDEEFLEYYFESEIDDIIRFYMRKWGYLIAICYHKRNINLENLKQSAKEAIANQMPFLNKWKRNSDCESHMINIVKLYCGSAWDINDRIETDLIRILLEPTVSPCFGAWRHFGAYTENQVLPLTVYGWYRNIIFMALDGEQEIDKKTADLWKHTLNGTLYGRISCLPGKLNCNIDLLDEAEIVWNCNQFRFEWEHIPFLENMFVTHIDFDSGNWSVTYHLGEKQKDREGNVRGYEASSKTKDFFYQQYYNELVECDPADTEYETMLGFADYPKILLMKEGSVYNNILRIEESGQRYIPLWERDREIKAFLEEHSDKDYYEWANLVKESEQFWRVTRYICWKKHHSYDAGKLSEIQEQYEEFLIDMFGAWYEKINGTRALG